MSVAKKNLRFSFLFFVEAQKTTTHFSRRSHFNLLNHKDKKIKG